MEIMRDNESSKSDEEGYLPGLSGDEVEALKKSSCKYRSKVLLHVFFTTFCFSVEVKNEIETSSKVLPGNLCCNLILRFFVSFPISYRFGKC